MTAPTPDPTTASVGERERLIEAILATRWPNGDRFNGVNEWTAGMIADSILANHAAPTVDGATVDEAAVFAGVVARGEYRRNRAALHCPVIDVDEVHRILSAALPHIAAAVPTSPTDTGGADDGLRKVAVDAARSAFHDDPEVLSASLTRVANALVQHLAAHPAPQTVVTDARVRRAGGAAEDAMLQHLGRDMGTLHRDDIMRAALTAALTEGGAE